MLQFFLNLFMTSQEAYKSHCYLQRELKDLTLRHKPTIVFLMETRARGNRIQQLAYNLKYKSYFYVEPEGLSGGLCLMWNMEVEIEIDNYSKNFIHTTITHKKEANFWDCTFIYGEPSPSRRHNLWSQIARLHWRPGSPWICLGDFNETLHSHEKVGLRPSQPWRLQRFNDFVHGSNLVDMNLKGCSFTWMSNPRNGFITREKLDMVLYN